MRKRKRAQDSIRGSPEYKLWKKSVLEYDHYTCQRCLCTIRRRLQAHHIYNFSKYKQLRFEVSNGITLCDHCHDSAYIGSFHKVYGSSNNTFEQLADFINSYDLDE